MMSVTDPKSEGHSLALVRAGFVASGSSLHRWCRENGEDTSNARRAIVGTWRGPKASLLKARLLNAAGVAV